MAKHAIKAPTDGWVRGSVVAVVAENDPSPYTPYYYQSAFIPLDQEKRIHAVLHWNGGKNHAPYVYDAIIEIYDDEFGWMETAEHVSVYDIDIDPGAISVKNGD